MGHLASNYWCSDCLADLSPEDVNYWPCEHCKVFYEGPESDAQREDCDCITWWFYDHPVPQMYIRAPVQGPHTPFCASQPPICDNGAHTHPTTEFVQPHHQTGRAARVNIEWTLF